ncbi:hypothetical protein [Streptodolium elevatio]
MPLTGRTPCEEPEDAGTSALPSPRGAGDGAETDNCPGGRGPARRGTRWLPTFARDVAVQVVGGLVVLGIAALITMLVAVV